MAAGKHPPFPGQEVVELLAGNARRARYDLRGLIVLDSSPREGSVQFNEVNKHCIVPDAPSCPAVTAAADTDAAGVGFCELHSSDDVRHCERLRVGKGED